jgi:hypothetical protein
MTTTAILIANVLFILVAASLTGLVMWLPSALVAGGDRAGSDRRRPPQRRR